MPNVSIQDMGRVQDGAHLLVRCITTDSLLQTLSYALSRDGVDVAGAQDLINDDRVGSLYFGGERV